MAGVRLLVMALTFLPLTSIRKSTVKIGSIAVRQMMNEPKAKHFLNYKSQDNHGIRNQTIH